MHFLCFVSCVVVVKLFSARRAAVGDPVERGATVAGVGNGRPGRIVVYVGGIRGYTTTIKASSDSVYTLYSIKIALILR